MNIFQQFFKSIYSPPTIAKFKLQGIGKTILYVLMLMIITFSVAAYQLGTNISNGVKQFQTVLKNDLPEFELNNSILLSDLEEPLYLKVDGVNYIFDTTGTLTITDIQQNYNQVLALLQEEAIFISDGISDPISQSIHYDQVGLLDFTKTDLEGLVETVIDLLPLIIIIFIVILYIIITALKFIGIFFLSLFGLIINGKIGIELSYKQVWILSAYAITLPTVFFAITDSLYIYIPYAITLYWFVAFIMLYLIFKEISKSVEDKEVPFE